MKQPIKVIDWIMVHLWIDSCYSLRRGRHRGLILKVSHLWCPFRNQWRRTHFGFCRRTSPSSCRRRWRCCRASPSSSPSSSWGAAAAFWGRRTWGRWRGAWRWSTRGSRSTWKGQRGCFSKQEVHTWGVGADVCIYQLPTKRGSLWSMLTTVLGST